MQHIWFILWINEINEWYIMYINICPDNFNDFISLKEFLLLDFSGALHKAAYVFYLKVSFITDSTTLADQFLTRPRKFIPTQENQHCEKRSLVSTVWMPSRALFDNFNRLIVLERYWRNCNYRYPQKILPHNHAFCMLFRYSHAQLFATLWTHVACQVYLSMGFSRQEYWSRPCPSSTMTF